MRIPVIDPTGAHDISGRRASFGLAPCKVRQVQIVHVRSGVRNLASSSNDNDGFPQEPWRADDGAVPSRGAGPPRAVDGVDAVAQYLADMSGQLESMARAAKLELVAYLLSMARTEADVIARTRPHDGDPKPR
jgi:hypothetical protein